MTWGRKERQDLTAGSLPRLRPRKSRVAGSGRRSLQQYPDYGAGLLKKFMSEPHGAISEQERVEVAS